jgi:hypothetical protein
VAAPLLLPLFVAPLFCKQQLLFLCYSSPIAPYRTSSVPPVIRIPVPVPVPGLATCTGGSIVQQGRDELWHCYSARAWLALRCSSSEIAPRRSDHSPLAPPVTLRRCRPILPHLARFLSSSLPCRSILHQIDHLTTFATGSTCPSTLATSPDILPTVDDIDNFLTSKKNHLQSQWGQQSLAISKTSAETRLYRSATSFPTDMTRTDGEDVS